MKYDYRRGVEVAKKRSKMWVVLPIFGLLGGAYILLNALSPSLSTPFDPPADQVAKKLTEHKPLLNEKRLYIPQINVDVAIVTGDTDAALELGAWHRKPENGDPINGGNFVLSAHRFNLGLLPSQTRAKSPFYHIDQLKEGDQIYVDYEGTRYAYVVSKTYKVDRTAIEIEQRSDDAKMTIYSCDLRGEKAGREVVEAKPIGTVAWNDGNPKIKTSSN